ncbi:MAG: hypoxanthine phosphoribosyltransferase [Anaerolineales bacterium]|nr:hypoxanthine phosphoribosyltransferase [Anaerolineales bacterium]MCB0156441.1 hypoxanthine phosphoribosyltransferase [Anaerolineae bacterium]
MFDDVSQILFTAAQIQARVWEIGQQISQDYAGQNPLLVGVLKGVVPFMADLLRAITIPVEVDFMAITSYSASSRHEGMVRLEKDLEVPVNGRSLLFVEDIIDTGLTLNYLLKTLRARSPASLDVCTMFNKEKLRLIDIPLRYKGFDLPDKFVVGYGLDYREKYRNLPWVGLLKPHVFQPKS